MANWYDDPHYGCNLDCTINHYRDDFYDTPVRVEVPKNYKEREAKLHKRRFGMKVNGKSVFLLAELAIKPKKKKKK